LASTSDNSLNPDPPLVKIKVRLQPDDAPGFDAEWLWAEPVGESRFLLRNVPFFAYGLSYGDSVSATLEDSILVFDKILDRGGHSTYRIYSKVEREDPRIIQLLGVLGNSHCDLERANNKLIGLDVLPEADADTVYQALEEAEAAGYISFDEGHCGHPLNPK
jgi:hypothetical protein